MKPNKVFVYGSLLSGLGNHGVLDDPSVTLVREDEITGVHMFDLGAFPGCAVIGKMGNTIKGEVYEVTSETVWSSLDALEGHPSFYERHVVITTGGEEVWVYLLPSERVTRCREVESGDWRQHYEHKKKAHMGT